MAEPQIETVTDGKTVHGVVAEFSDVDSLLAACRRVRDAGFTKADAFTPFPVHGIDKALGIKPTVLPWIALGAGLTGTCIALTMQIWMNGIDYQYIISGKPYISLPAFIPVTFELTILLASFGTFFGMWALNGLPRFSNPMFTSPRFDRATDDTFFLFLDAKDPRFEEQGARSLLADLGGEYIEPVIEDESPQAIPKALLVGLATVIALSFIPALVVARMRVTKSESPRFHIFPDMDFSPAKDAQQSATLFADGRAMRPDVPGTVSRGELNWDLDFQTGIDIEALARIDAVQANRLVAMMRPDENGDGEIETEEAEATAVEEVAEADEEPQEPTAAEASDDETAEDGKAADGGETTAGEDTAAEEVEPESASAEAETEAKAETEMKETAAAEASDEDEAAEAEVADAEASQSESSESEVSESAASESEPSDSDDSDPTANDEQMPVEQKPAEQKPAEQDQGAPSVEVASGSESSSEEAAGEEPSAEAGEAMAGSEDSSAGAGESADKTPWLRSNPLTLTADVLERGQEQFNIYCAVCHGVNGRGNGLVNQRAQKILATTWTPPSNLHDETLYQDAYPDGKLFSTITNGIRKMPGYAGQIQARDRWAIVGYVRALQASRDATLEDVPEDQRSALEQRQAEIRQQLEAAAAEAAEEEADAGASTPAT